MMHILFTNINQIYKYSILEGCTFNIPENASLTKIVKPLMGSETILKSMKNMRTVVNRASLSVNRRSLEITRTVTLIIDLFVDLENLLKKTT